MLSITLTFLRFFQSVYSFFLTLLFHHLFQPSLHISPLPLNFYFWYSFVQLVPVPFLQFHIQQRQVVGKLGGADTRCSVIHFTSPQPQLKTSFPTNLNSYLLMWFGLLPELAAQSSIQETSSNHQNTALHIEGLGVCSESYAQTRSTLNCTLANHTRAKT